MRFKTGKNVLVNSDDRALLYAGLLLVCALLVASGMDALALWSFLPAAGLTELLPVIAAKVHHREVQR